MLSQDHIGSRFDPTSPDFTLDSLVALRLDTHSEFIADLSVAATKELAIENSIKVCASVARTVDAPVAHNDIRAPRPGAMIARWPAYVPLMFIPGKAARLSMLMNGLTLT
jgi:hypothetical protein